MTARDDLIAELTSKAVLVPEDWTDRVIALLDFTSELTSVVEIEVRWGSWRIFADERTLWVVRDDDLRAVWAVDLDSLAGADELQDWIDHPDQFLSQWTELIVKLIGREAMDGG